jgi:hypothetical protein
MAGPVFPMGKNSSGSSSRQAARSRQSMLIVLLDEAVGAVRTAVGPVVGREWFRGAEPVVGSVVGRDTRWVRVVLVVISQGLVVFSGTWWSGLAFAPLRAARR